MRRNRRVDLEELRKLCHEGYSGKEIAARFKVSQGAISQNKRALGIAKSNVALESAKTIQRREVRAMDRILKLDQLTQETLDRITGKLKASSDQEEKEWLESQRKFIEESRKQVGLWAEIYRTILYQDELKVFKKVVLNTIGEAAPEVRNEILRRLEAQRVAGSIFRGSEPPV
jgi:hypothetical protein